MTYQANVPDPLTPGGWNNLDYTKGTKKMATKNFNPGDRVRIQGGHGITINEQHFGYPQWLRGTLLYDTAYGYMVRVDPDQGQAWPHLEPEGDTWAYTTNQLVPLEEKPTPPGGIPHGTVPKIHTDHEIYRALAYAYRRTVYETSNRGALDREISFHEIVDHMAEVLDINLEALDTHIQAECQGESVESLSPCTRCYVVPSMRGDQEYWHIYCPQCGVGARAKTKENAKKIWEGHATTLDSQNHLQEGC